MKRLMILAGAIAACAACAPPYDVVVDANGPLPVVHTPDHAAGAGQTVRVLVKDSVWGNRWGAAVSDSALPAIGRSLVFMEENLSALTKWYAPAARSTIQPSRSGLVPFDMPDRTPRRGLFMQPGAACRSPEARASVQGEYRNAGADAERAAKGVSDALATLRGSEYAAALAFASNTAVHDFARRLAADPLAHDAERTLVQAAASGRRLTPAQLDTLLSASLAYAARIRALQVAAPRSAPKADSSLTELLQRVASGREDYAAAVRTRDHLASRFGRCLELTPAATVTFEYRVNGVDIRPLLDSAGMRRLERVHEDLAAVERNVRTLAGALNQLPYWTRNEREEMVFARAFEGNRAVTFQLRREPRYGTFLVEEAAPQGGRDETGTDRAAAAAPGPASGAAKPRADVADAAQRVEVLPRYRFHLGAGLVRSSLRTRQYETAADTVDGVAGVRLRQTGETPNQVFPTAFLSYNVFPLGGKSYDAREYQGLPSPRRMGLSLQAGVSLLDPTENVFLGATTELFPGVHLGFGHHLAYVQATSFEPGEFVADTRGAPVEKRWRGEWSAWSVGVDADVFFSTLGALFK